jgi:hypothetical protein
MAVQVVHGQFEGADVAVQEVHGRSCVLTSGVCGQFWCAYMAVQEHNFVKFRCTKRNNSSKIHARSFIFVRILLPWPEFDFVPSGSVHFEQDGSPIVTNKKVTS